MTEQTGKNVGELGRRIERLAEDVYDAHTGGMDDLKELVQNSIEAIGGVICEHIEEKLSEPKLPDGLEEIIEQRLKASFDEFQNRIAVMQNSVRKDLTDIKSTLADLKNPKYWRRRGQ